MFVGGPTVYMFGRLHSVRQWIPSKNQPFLQLWQFVDVSVHRLQPVKPSGQLPEP